MPIGNTEDKGRECLPTLTCDEIANMTAGAALDALVSKVLRVGGREGCPERRYSTDDRDALFVFREGLLLTGNASIAGDMEDFDAQDTMLVTVGQFSIYGPMALAICQMFLMSAMQPYQ